MRCPGPILAGWMSFFILFLGCLSFFSDLIRLEPKIVPRFLENMFGRSKMGILKTEK
jgi:hypothetical protein